MVKKVQIEIEAKVWNSGEDIHVGDLILYKDEVYKFDGYEYGTYPYATNIVTHEQIGLPW